MTPAVPDVISGPNERADSVEPPIAAERPRRLFPIALVMTAFIAVPAGFLTWSYASCGSVAGVRRYLSGDRVIPESYTLDFGTRGPAQFFPVTFHLKNLGSEPVRVIGAHVSCNCTPTDELPFVIGPHEMKTFDILVNTLRTEKSYAYKARAILYTNDPQHELELFVTGKVEVSRPDRDPS